MQAVKTEMLQKLRREIAVLQGHRPGLQPPPTPAVLGPMASAFADGILPPGAVHEFLADRSEATAATCGFMTALLAPLLQTKGVLFWISPSQQVFPPGLSYFGIAPDRVIFVNLHREQDILWAMEEVLQCGSAAAVVAEIPRIGFTASRRLQLRAEQSGVTGFIIRPHSGSVQTTTCATRWRISPAPGQPTDGLPGLGALSWQVELLKVRNGRPGSWEIKWTDERFVSAGESVPMMPVRRQKTG